MMKNPLIRVLKFQRLACLALMATALLGGCASLVGPRDVFIPLSDLQASLDRRFPLDKRLLEIFNLQISHPRLALQPDSNRLLATMDVTLGSPLLKNSRQGSLALSGVPGIDVVRHAVVLQDLHIDALSVDGLDASVARQVSSIAGLLGEQALNNLPVYTFDPAAFRYAGVSFLPTKINAKSNGLVVTFEPAR